MNLEQLNDILIKKFGKHDHITKTIAKFLDIEYRKTVYEFILYTLIYRSDNAFRLPWQERRPFICYIVKDHIFQTSDDRIELYGHDPDLYESESDILHGGVNGLKLPLTILLPELKRPDIDAYSNSWFVYTDFDSRISIVHDALKHC